MLLPNIYGEKKVCLIAPGESLNKYQLDFSKYDIVVGVNRIYKTVFLEKINILYNSFGKGDRHNIKNMFEILKNQVNFSIFIGCPFLQYKNCKRNLNIEKSLEETKFCDSKKFLFLASNSVQIKPIPLCGMFAVDHIISSGASFVDMFGFDFYSGGYIENLEDFHLMHKKYHNVENNKKFLKELIERNPQKISWNQ